jgi:hypothetical protein
MEGEEPEERWDVRIARHRQGHRLPEAEYRAALARGEIERVDATAKIIRGDALIAKIQKECGHRECMLAFSCGKDSIAAYLAIRKKFDRVVPYFMYGIPDLEFVEESLRYYEREMFDEPIIRMPHPSFYMQLHHCIFQPPDRVPLLHAAKLGQYDHDYMRSLVIEEAKLPLNTMIATGLRAYDNTMRRMALVTYGPINRKSATFWPVWDMRKQDVIDTIKAAKLHLPVDYDLFGRTFDGICAEDLIPIKKHFPRDYQRILEWFPLADIELFRLERYGTREIWSLATGGRGQHSEDRRPERAQAQAEAQGLRAAGAVQPRR